MEALHLALPKSFDELRALRHTVELYRLNYGPQLLQLLTAAYIFLQVGPPSASHTCTVAASCADLPAGTGCAALRRRERVRQVAQAGWICS